MEIEEIDYLPLGKLLKKVLPHGIENVPKVHKELTKYFRPDGYIPVEELVRIINRNDSIGKHVKSKLFNNIFRSITEADILNAINIPFVVTWFKIAIIDNKLMIRSNFDHTIDIIECEKVADSQITYAKEGFKVYLRMKKNETYIHTQRDTFVTHKNMKFWSSEHPHSLYYDEYDKDWVNVCLDVEGALNQGFLLYMVEGRVIITRKNLPRKCSIYFKIPKELFFIERCSIKEF